MSESNPIRTTDIYSGNYKELMDAAKAEDVVAMEKVINANHINLDYADSVNGVSLLNWCIFNKKEKSFETLLQFGANPNWQDISGKFAPPITEAAQIDNTTKYLELVLQYNGNYNLLSKKIAGISNQTPLLGSIFSKRMENVKLLVEKGADVNLTQDSLWTPLAETIVQGKIEMTKYLLEKGADYRNLKFRTVTVATDKNGQVIFDSDGSPVMRSDKELNILSLLRNTQYALGSNEHKVKMKVVEFLKSKELDYWSSPIPEKIKNEYKADTNYLFKY